MVSERTSLGLKYNSNCICVWRREGEDERETECEKREKCELGEFARRAKRVSVRLGVYVCVCVREEAGRERWEEDVHLYMDVQNVCALVAAFVLARVHLHRGERIWQACLLSPQNNCLWITWGESHWRYLEMTLPGDSLNHVHIRSEREVWFRFAWCVRILVHVCVCVCVCVFVQIRRDTLSPSSGDLHRSNVTAVYYTSVYTNAYFRLIHHLWLSSISCSWQTYYKDILRLIVLTSTISTWFVRHVLALNP